MMCGRLGGRHRSFVGTKLLGCAAVWGAVILGATLGGITVRRPGRTRVLRHI